MSVAITQLYLAFFLFFDWITMFDQNSFLELRKNSPNSLIPPSKNLLTQENGKGKILFC